MQVLIIIISLALLIYVGYKGYSVILFAPLFALLAAVVSGQPLLPTHTEVFMVKLGDYVKNFFPIFLLGAVFGKVMDGTGAAKSIARAIIKTMGAGRAIIAVVLSCAILTYGGVSLFVVAFAVYPLAAALFREADIPRRLIPGCIALGAFTFTMTALPGTPQIQNLIPTKYFGTNMYAAPTIGIIAALLMFGLGIAWLEYRKSKAKAAGEGYGKGKEGEVEGEIGEGGDLPNPILAILPLVVVLGLNLFLTNYISGWDPAFLQPYKITLSSVVATWSLIIALVVGIILAIIFGWRQIKNDIAKALNEGTIGSLLAIMNTASEVGYGNVISALPGFRIIANALLGIQGSPLISEALAVNILAGITGSASGGMSIALETMGEQYMEWAARTGISPQLLHRIASLSCGGLDTLPHNGAVITLLAICGLTHRESYVDIGMVSAVIPVLSTAICVILASVFRIV